MKNDENLIDIDSLIAPEIQEAAGILLTEYKRRGYKIVSVLPSPGKSTGAMIFDIIAPDDPKGKENGSI